MIITIFIFTLIWVNSLDSWPESCPKLTIESNLKTMIITTFILCWPGSIRVDSSNTWPKLYPESIPNLGFKTIIITIFIITLTYINNQPHSWPENCPGRPPNRVLKYDNNYFYSYTNTSQLDSWPGPQPVTQKLP